MWRAAAAWNGSTPRPRKRSARSCCGQVRRGPVPHYAFWALTRLGTRRQFYGPLNTVIHPQVAESGSTRCSTSRRRTTAERLGWGFCLAELARRSGLRGVDVSDEHRHGVARRAAGDTGARPAWPRMVEEVVEPEGDERSRLFGETLPIGLRLAGG